MINSVTKGQYVKFFETKPHDIHKVESVNRKRRTLTIKCLHCNMIIHGIPYFLMKIISKPKEIKKSSLTVSYNKKRGGIL